MSELITWLMVFLRVSAMLAVFPIFLRDEFSGATAPCAGSIDGGLVTPALPAGLGPAQDIWGWVGVMAMEIGVGLLFGLQAG